MFIFIYIYPIAYGQPAPGPRDASFLDVKSCKNSSPEAPKSLKNPSQEAQKSFKMVSWRGLGGVWEALGGVLEASWPQDGTKSQKDPQRTPDGPPTDPHWTPKLEAKINEKSILRASKI